MIKPMRVITLNVNGIRSAARKGLFEWLARLNADVVCLQEVKAQQADLTDQMLAPKGFHGFFNCAEKKGSRSGTGFACVIRYLRLGQKQARL